MALARTWNLRLNLDEFNSLATSLFLDADRAYALQGLGLGMNGGPLPEGVPDAFRRGWEMGHAMRQEAEAFRAKKSEDGALGGRPKKPRGLPDGLPDGSPQGLPDGEPYGEPNPQSTIHNPTNPKQHPPNPPRGERSRWSQGMFDDLIPDQLKTPEFVATWRNWMQDRKDRRKPLTELAALEQLTALAKVGQNPAIEAIRRSIANGWQGLFPERTANNGPPRPDKWNGFNDRTYTQSERKGPNGESLI